MIIIIVFWSSMSFAQIWQEITSYDKIAIRLLYEKLLKANKNEGDCQCSNHIHVNYPLVLNDSIYSNSFGNTDPSLLRRLYPKLISEDWLLCYILEEDAACGIKPLGNRALNAKLPKAKKWKGKKLIITK